MKDMLDFFKKIFGSKEKVEQVEIASPRLKKEKLTLEKLEAEPEMLVAAMIATINAAGDKDISNFRIRKIRKF